MLYNKNTIDRRYRQLYDHAARLRSNREAA
jgi:hypothetical protein